MPSLKADAVLRERVLVPTKIAKAFCFEMVRDATRIAVAKEKTIPTFENVRRSPDAIPKLSPGAALMIAVLLDGKKQPAPIAPTM
jgi:hypothetical protein